MRARFWGWATGLGTFAVLSACGGEEFSASGTGGASTGGAAGSGGAPSGGGGTTAGGSGGVAGSGAVAGSGGTAGAGGSAGADGGCTDADKDGKTTCAGDCDDADPSVTPGGPEVCGDTKDNDCKNGADDGCNGLGAYVSEQVGLDTNPGTKALPLKTIMKGIANADTIRKGFGTPNAKIDVFIAQGTYKTEKVTLTEGISLTGGHHCQSSSNCSWNQNPGLYESVIEAVDFEGTLAGQTITRATTIEKLTLKGKSGAPPGGSFGAAALMLDGGHPVVRSCKIIAPDVTGAYPEGRSAGIFVAWSSDNFGPYIANNTITGGQSTWADGIIMSNRPGQSKTGNADILNNTISGGAGSQGSAGISFHNSGPNTQITGNDLNAGTSQSAYAFGIAGTGTANIDKNRVNLPGTTAKCSGSGRCGGIVCESCSGTITNNVVFGADALLSSALHLVEAEKAAGNIVVHSNYLNGAGSTSGSAKSAAISVEMGTCTTCGFKGKTGRIRGNILELGQSPTRCGVVEIAPIAKQMHPEALEFNFFSSVGAATTPCFYSFYDGSSYQIHSTASAVNTTLSGKGIPAASNLDGDPMVDATNKYHLKSGSPCISKSTNNEAPPKDMDGQARPMGSGYDIGPDEVN